MSDEGEPRPPPPLLPGWPPRFGASPGDREALLAISVAEPLPRRLRELAWREGGAAGCLAAIRGGKLGQGAAERVAAADPGRIRGALDRCGARLVTPADREYPAALLDLEDPPAWLFVRGGTLPRPPGVAVVGARAATPYGREVAEAVGEGLARAGVAVASGAARGIDSAAHRGALRGGGPTVAVLGCGIDRAYPADNRPLLNRIAERGAVVGEYLPGVRALPHRFPARNRIVAGMSRATVVVEGAAGSGSLITAGFAADVGRDVFAVPGPVTAPQSEAPLALLRDGARLVRGPQDVLEDLGLDTDGGTGGHAVLGLAEIERRVLSGLGGSPLTAEAVAEGAGMTPASILPVLSSLELRGLVRCVGGRFERTAAAGGGGRG